MNLLYISLLLSPSPTSVILFISKDFFFGHPVTFVGEPFLPLQQSAINGHVYGVYSTMGIF